MNLKSIFIAAAACMIALPGLAQETEMAPLAMPGGPTAPRPPAVAPAKPEWTAPSGDYALSFRWLGWMVKPQTPAVNAPATTPPTAPAPAAPLLEIVPTDRTPMLCTIKERVSAGQAAGVTQRAYSDATMPRKDGFVGAYAKADLAAGKTVTHSAYTLVGDAAVLRVGLEAKDSAAPIAVRETAYVALVSQAATRHVFVECFIAPATPKDRRGEITRLLDTLTVKGAPFSPKP